MSCVGGHRRSLTPHLPDILEIIQPPATTRTRRTSVAFRGLLTVRLRRPPTSARRCVAPSTSHVHRRRGIAHRPPSGRSPDYPRRRDTSFTSRVRRRRRRTHRVPPGHPPAGPPGHPPRRATTHHMVGPVAIKDGLRAASGEAPGPSTRLRGSLHLASPVIKTCSPPAFATTLRSIRAVCRRDPPDITATPSVCIRAIPSRASEALDPESKTEGKIKRWIFVVDIC